MNLQLIATALLMMAEVPAACLAPDSQTAVVGSRVWVIDVHDRPIEERFVAHVLQGLANRDGPRVFVKLGETCRWNWFQYTMRDSKKPPVWNPAVIADYQKKYPAIDDYWIDWLGSSFHRRLQLAKLSQAISGLRNIVKGVVLYDDLKHDATAVATLCGLEDALPMTSELRAAAQKEGIDLPIVFDFTKVHAGFDPSADLKLQTERWALEHLLPRCKKDGLVALEPQGSGAPSSVVDVDQAVQRRWFVYDLDHTNALNQVKAKTGGSKPDPPDKEVLEPLLDQIQPWSLIFGWARPGESQFIRTLNRHKLLGLCSGVPNTSFFAKLPPITAAFKQKHQPVTPETVSVEKKIYISFMVNEGDTIKSACALMGDGSWIMPERGKLPINWGIDPALIQTHPGLMYYFYSTMTDQDYFFSATSGWGYAHTSLMSKDELIEYAKLIRRGGEIGDLRYIDMWWIGGLYQNGTMGPFLDAAGMRGLSDWDGSQQRVLYTKSGVPIIKCNYYYLLKDPAAFASTLQEDMKDVAPPWFLVVYGGTPYKFAEVARQLPTEKFKIVLLDELYSAAERARPQMENRVWKPGPNAPKGVAP